MGGLETFIMNVYRQIDKSKIQFDFLVHTMEECAFDKEIIELGGSIYKIPSRREGIAKNRFALDEFFKSYGSVYNIVHQHASSLSYVEPLLSAKRNGIKIRILHSHSSKQSGSKLNIIAHRWNMLHLGSIATHYFACSDLAARWLFGRKIVYKREYTLINNGVSLDKFNYNSHLRYETREKLEISNETKVVGHVGQISYPKNHDFLIEIFKKILLVNKDCILVLVGEGSLKDTISKKIIQEGLSKNIKMLGERSDINNLLNAMDIFVFPSLYEGLPVALVEAQATGLKCIVSSSITRRVNITDLITYYDLMKSPEQWAAETVNSWDYSRKSASTQIKKSEFDIESVTAHISELYIRLGSEK